MTATPLYGRNAEDQVQRQETGAPVFEEDGVTPVNLEPIIVSGKTATEEA